MDKAYNIEYEKGRNIGKTTINNSNDDYLDISTDIVFYRNLPYNINKELKTEKR